MSDAVTGTEFDTNSCPEHARQVNEKNAERGSTNEALRFTECAALTFSVHTRLLSKIGTGTTLFTNRQTKFFAK